ncbi:MAG: pyridoxamine 5'-phosphate oxidase [Nocardioides sp.]|nr:pyridoxamine 5'-phosphate oxidase [Nocardioides sp.]
MSIPVDVADLVRTLEDFAAGYLLSTSDGRVKAVSVAPQLADGVLVARAPGRGSCANVAANPQVTVLFPPLGTPGFTLLVDGTAVVDAADVRVTPTSAVLHKPAGGPA